MSDATAAADTIPSPGSTIRPAEAAHFAGLAKEWWDPKGSSAMLHKLNPVRLRYIRAAIDAHWGGDPDSVRPLLGKTALDVGCGAGLLCEPLARLGAEATGIDAAAENVAVARAHAEGAGLAIRYLAGELAAAGTGEFDLVTCLEVLEHVADKPAFVRQLAGRVAPEGLLVLSTPNRTPMSRMLLVGAAEAAGLVPRGTHHWADFVTPDEVRDLLAAAGLTMSEPQGIGFSPAKGLHLTSDLSLNYIVTATRA
ncbi:MAG: bifunctional 2-polyprenyl-6-hydroxyphenol methylase/3-demethylubiquinol 3-O-methyltransferase UbiG [Tsuneonella sp.]